MRREQKYICRYCGSPHGTAFMANLCFDTDMAILDKTNLKISKSKVTPKTVEE